MRQYRNPALSQRFFVYLYSSVSTTRSIDAFDLVWAWDSNDQTSSRDIKRGGAKPGILFRHHTADDGDRTRDLLLTKQTLYH